MISVEGAKEVVTAFDADGDDLAGKSRELVLQMLEQTPAPFSRHQFTPGHVTCTALVMHPRKPLVLMMMHHRLRRWLLPGGHVEPGDDSLAGSAAREAREETCVELDSGLQPVLAGVDVHGIPAGKGEPFHLHHDLIWCFRAVSETVVETDEAPEVLWAKPADWDRLGVAPNIRRSFHRAARFLGH